jgi:hypothetical protein
MKYIFFGIVHPERATLTISNIHGEIGAEDSHFKGIISVSIKLSQVAVEVDTDAKIATVDLRNTIENFVHTMVDVYGYLKGYAYTVEIFSVYVPETGKSEVFGIDVAKITQDEKNRPLNYNDTLRLALTTPELYMSLKDLRDAIKRPFDTFFHCRRATETIAQYFTKSGNKAIGWQNTIQALELNKDDLNEIKTLGGGQRHGRYGSVSGNKRVDIMMKTWGIVDKFILYLKSQESNNNDGQIV